MKAIWITLVLLSFPSFMDSVYAPCDRNFMGRMGSGIITSPNFPLDYPAASSGICLYRIYSKNYPSHVASDQQTKDSPPSLISSDPTQETLLETAEEKLKVPFWKTARRLGQWKDEEEKARGVNVNSPEIVCFTFHRFSLANSPNNCTMYDSSHACLEFQGETMYCNKGSKSTLDAQDNNPKSVFLDDFCWKMKFGYLELRFVYPDSGFSSKTDTGFYATFKVYNGYTFTESSPSYLYSNRTPYANTAPCPPDSFTCFDRGCIPVQLTCNGRWNCEDGSDEDYINARCAGMQSYSGCDFELTEGIIFERCHLRGANWVTAQSSLYGPRYDHTIGKTLGPGNFTFTIFSMPELTLKSEIEVTVTEKPLARCFRFWYFMSGNGIGWLGIFINATAPQTSPGGLAWLREGHQGSMWHLGEVDIPPYVQEITELSFKAKKGSSSEVSLAIDDISMTNGSCYKDDISCTFELGTCGWRIEDSPSVSPWQRRQQGMDASVWGPATDCNGDADGFFMTYNFSGQPQARMVSRPVSDRNQANNLWCLSFCYHLNGPDMAQYVIKLKYGDGKEGSEYWDDVKTEKYWRVKKILLPIHTPVQVIFETMRTTRGANVQISLDNIVLVPSACHNVPTEPPPTRPTTTSGPVYCPPGYFQCQNGQCVSKSRVCDGRFDCSDLSDEQNCGMTGRLSVGAIAGIVSALLVVAVATLSCFLWARKRAERPTNNNNNNPNNTNIVPDDNILSTPMTYGEAPPLYSESRGTGDSFDGPPLDPWAYPGGLHAYHASQALAWEPPPAYEASQGHSADYNIVVPEAPCYSPRLDPPPFEAVVNSPGERGQQPRGEDGSKQGESLRPVLRNSGTNLQPQGLPQMPRPNPMRNSLPSSDSQTHSAQLNDSTAGTAPTHPPHINTVIPSAPDPATVAIIGAPATGQDLQRYYNPRPIVYQVPSRIHHSSRRSFRRSLRRSRRRSRNMPSSGSNHLSDITVPTYGEPIDMARTIGNGQGTSSEV